MLFGSRARGDAKPGSDYDIAVFLSGMESRWDEAGVLAEARTAADEMARCGTRCLTRQGLLAWASPVTQARWTAAMEEAPPIQGLELWRVWRDCQDFREEDERRLPGSALGCQRKRKGNTGCWHRAVPIRSRPKLADIAWFSKIARTSGGQTMQTGLQATCSKQIASGIREAGGRWATQLYCQVRIPLLLDFHTLA